LNALLSRFEGRDEWTVTLSADVAALSARVERSDPVLSAFEEQLRGVSEGARYFLEKKRQQRITQLVEQALAAIEAELHSSLFALDAEFAAPVGRGTTVLIERSRFTAMEVGLAAIEAEHADAGVRFEIVGPWPPYSFAATLDATACPEEHGRACS
jgi:hypothetical protein